MFIIYETPDGHVITDKDMKNICDKIYKVIKSEFPKEVQTYEGVKHIVNKVVQDLNDKKLDL